LVALLVSRPSDAGTVFPDSFAGPFTDVREKGPVRAPVTIYPTDQGQRIKNADGSEPRYSRRIPAGGEFTIPIPRTVNGVQVTDLEQVTGKPGDPLDPGHLYIAAFGTGPMDVLHDFIATHGEFLLPDFFGTGLNDVHYGVNLETIGSAGSDFVNSHSFGETFTIDSSGNLPELAGYVFSSTPLIFVPGVGWTGTPLTSGQQLTYVAFHDLSAAVPEPTSLLLFAVGGLAALLGTRYQPKKIQAPST
jgi:hypothetical protein